MNEKILILGRHWDIVEEIEKIVCGQGYDTHKGSCCAETLQTLLNDSFAAVITGLATPGLDDLAFIKKIRDINDGIAIIILTGSPTIETAVQAFRDCNVDDFLMLPLKSVDQLKNSLNRCMEKTDSR